MLNKTLLIGAAALLPLTLGAAPAYAAETANVQLAPVNGSGASGTAQIRLDEAANTLTVTIESVGLVPGLPPAQHVHIGGQNICPDQATTQMERVPMGGVQTGGGGTAGIENDGLLTFGAMELLAAGAMALRARPMQAQG